MKKKVEPPTEFAPTHPPNPAKEKDSRFIDYQRKFGDESWELDALEPSVIVEMINGEIESLVDQDEWDVRMEQEQKERQVLFNLSTNWKEVSKYMMEKYG